MAEDAHTVGDGDYDVFVYSNTHRYAALIPRLAVDDYSPCSRIMCIKHS